MKPRLFLLGLGILYCANTIISQCTFAFMSNDTVYQDNIEYIALDSVSNEIIVIGSRIAKEQFNDSTFNAPFMEIRDLCGGLLRNFMFNVVGKYKLRHEAMATHNTYKEEPIGNKVITLKNGNYLLVEKAIDTLTKTPVLILLEINKNGSIVKYKTQTVTYNELNENTIKNVLALKDERLLIIYWDFAFQYTFNYFDNNLNFEYKQSFSLGRGIRSIQAIGNNEFICSSLAYDATSFQFYKLDSAGEIKWMVTPYNSTGLIRELKVFGDLIYVTGGVASMGVFLIADMEGNILKKYEYNDFYCKTRFCSSYRIDEESIVLAGYIQNCDRAHKNGTDIVIAKIDKNGDIVWHKSYNFLSNLGTSGDGGYYSDYGGFYLIKLNDGSFVTSGKVKYVSIIPGKILHEDRVLIKTIPNEITSVFHSSETEDLNCEFKQDLSTNSIDIVHHKDLIKRWGVFSIQGQTIIKGNEWIQSLNLNEFRSGTYLLYIENKYNIGKIIKFVKK